MTPKNHDQALPVLLEMRGDIGVIWLNDGHRRNALCADIAGGVIDALERSKTLHARAIVLGSTQNAFCAGADIREMLAAGWLTGDPTTEKTPLDLFEALELDDRPIIAAIDGLALGGGVELALACDLVVASESAVFSLPEISLGVIPNTAMARLPSLIGPRAALELIWTRSRLTALQAQTMGLVSRLVTEGDPVEAAISLAESIVRGAPPGAIASVKHGIRKGESWSCIRALLGTLRQEEWKEGFSAFLEKRKPDYEAFWRDQ